MAETAGAFGNWLFQIASHPRHGAGHVQRCLVLARALPGRSLLSLDPGADKWTAPIESARLRWAWRGEEPPGPWAGTVVDGYEFTSEQLERWARSSPPLVYMDDLQAPPACAALAINSAPQMVGASLGAVPALLGPRYALIAPKYREPVQVRAQVDRVLLTFGARDSKNATSLALDALALSARDHAFMPAVEVAMSRDAPHLQAVQERVGSLGARARLEIDCKDMVVLYRRADLVVGAGGVSLLERMAMGLPSVTVTLADNQQPSVEGAARLGGTVAAGHVLHLSAADLAGSIVTLAHDAGQRQAMAAAARAMVDGRGAERAAAELVKLSSDWHRIH